MANRNILNQFTIESTEGVVGKISAELTDAPNISLGFESDAVSEAKRLARLYHQRKPLHLSYAQFELLFKLKSDPTAVFIENLRARLGGLKVAEALVNRGILEKHPHSYGLTAFGREIFNYIHSRKGEAFGTIIKQIRERWTYV